MPRPVTWLTCGRWRRVATFGWGVRVVRDPRPRHGPSLENPPVGPAACWPHHWGGVVRRAGSSHAGRYEHADQDPGESLEFDPQLTELLRIDACSYFKQRTELEPEHLDVIRVLAGLIGASPTSMFAQAQLGGLRTLPGPR